jgi:CheY-like chemotaxis protein
LIEDDKTVLQITREMVKSFDFEVLTAPNGKKALEVFEKNQKQITLVLTDMVMPEMDGLELVNELRKKDPYVKVIVLTGYPLGEDAKKLKQFGIATWIQKPVTLNQLAQAISETLRNR